MAIAGDSYDLTNFVNAFHRVFVHNKDVDLFLFDSPFLKRIPVTDGFVGTDEERVKATSFAGGYGFSSGASSLPRTNESNLIRPRLTAKRYYAMATVESEAIAAAVGSKGSFFDLVNRVKLDLRRSIDNGLSLALVKGNIDNECVLGVIATGGVSGSGPYTLTLDSTYHEWLFHNKMIVSIEDGNTDLFEVTDVSSTGITVSGLASATQVPAAGDEIFLQGGDGNSFLGLEAAFAQSGTLYNVTIGTANRWIARVTDKSGVAVNEHMLFNEMLQVQRESGECPNLIVCGMEQYMKIAEMLANKRELSGGSDRDAMGHDSTLKLDGPCGAVDIIWDRHIPKDQILFINTNRIELRKRPLEGMVAGPGGDLLMSRLPTGTDDYLITYRCFGNFYIQPTYHAKLHNLDTSV